MLLNPGKLTKDHLLNNWHDLPLLVVQALATASKPKWHTGSDTWHSANSLLQKTCSAEGICSIFLSPLPVFSLLHFYMASLLSEATVYVWHFKACFSVQLDGIKRTMKLWLLKWGLWLIVQIKRAIRDKYWGQISVISKNRKYFLAWIKTNL